MLGVFRQTPGGGKTPTAISKFDYTMWLPLKMRNHPIQAQIRKEICLILTEKCESGHVIMPMPPTDCRLIKLKRLHNLIRGGITGKSCNVWNSAHTYSMPWGIFLVIGASQMVISKTRHQPLRSLAGLILQSTTIETTLNSLYQTIDQRAVKRGGGVYGLGPG